MSQLKAVREEEFSLTGGKVCPLFYLNLKLIELRPIHIREGNLL